MTAEHKVLNLDTITSSIGWEGETTLLSDIYIGWFSHSGLPEYIRRLEFLQFEVNAAELESARQGKLSQLKTQLLTARPRARAAENPENLDNNQHLLTEEIINWVKSYTAPKTRFQKLKYFAPKISLLILGLGAAAMAAWGAVILFAPFSAIPFGVLLIWFVLCVFATLAFSLVTMTPYRIADSLLEKRMMAEVCAAVEKQIPQNNNTAPSDSKDQILSDLPAALNSSPEENDNPTTSDPALDLSPQQSQTSVTPASPKQERDSDQISGMMKD